MADTPARQRTVTQDDVRNRVTELTTEIARRRQDLVVSPVLPGHRLFEDLDLDSIAHVDLMVAVETEFGIRIDDGDHDLAEVFYTIDSLSAYVVACLQRDGRAG